MVTRVQKWGNSQGLRISRQVLADAHLAVGDEVDVIVRDGVIVITSVNMVRGRYDLRQLVSRIPGDYEPQEEGWGPPVGKEIW